MRSVLKMIRNIVILISKSKMDDINYKNLKCLSSNTQKSYDNASSFNFE
jgi:hypothetical protein